MQHVAVDHLLPLGEIAAALGTLALDPRPPAGEVPEDMRLEALIAAQEFRAMEHPDREPTLSPITCPECHGSLREIRDGELLRFRCHTGHAFTLDALGVLQADAWERALYGALRAQQERAQLVHRMAAEARRHGAARSAAQLQQRADSYEEGAELLRRLIGHGTGAAAASEASER
jgi:two-component system chemotaxis response regulator CheB